MSLAFRKTSFQILQAVLSSWNTSSKLEAKRPIPALCEVEENKGWYKKLAAAAAGPIKMGGKWHFTRRLLNSGFSIWLSPLVVAGDGEMDTLPRPYSQVCFWNISNVNGWSHFLYFWWFPCAEPCCLPGRAAGKGKLEEWGCLNKNSSIFGTLKWQSCLRNIFPTMPFPFSVIGSVFNFKERLWHGMLINELLACFSMNVVLLYIYIFTSDKDDFFSSGNVTIHAWLIKEERNAWGTHPDGGGEEEGLFSVLGIFYCLQAFPVSHRTEIRGRNAPVSGLKTVWAAMPEMCICFLCL